MKERDILLNIILETNKDSINIYELAREYLKMLDRYTTLTIGTQTKDE